MSSNPCLAIRLLIGGLLQSSGKDLTLKWSHSSHILTQNWLIDLLASPSWQIWTGKSWFSVSGGTGRKPDKAARGWALYFPRSTQAQRPPSSCWNVNPTFSCVCYGRTAPQRMRSAVTTCLQRASISTAIYLVSCHYVTRTVKHISLPGWSLGLFYERPRRRSLQPKRASTFYTEVLRALKCVFTRSDRDPTGLFTGATSLLLLSAGPAIPRCPF